MKTTINGHVVEGTPDEMRALIGAAPRAVPPPTPATRRRRAGTQKPTRRMGARAFKQLQKSAGMIAARKWVLEQLSGDATHLTRRHLLDRFMVENPGSRQRTVEARINHAVRGLLHDERVREMKTAGSVGLLSLR